MALKIPIDDLLDGTKTVKNLETKFGPKYNEQNDPNLFSETAEENLPSAKEETNYYKAEKYETEFTTDLEHVFSKQQKKFFATSSKVFSDMKTNFNTFQVNSGGPQRRWSGRTTVGGKPPLNPIDSRKNLVNTQNNGSETESDFNKSLLGTKILSRPISAQVLVNHTAQLIDQKKRDSEKGKVKLRDEKMI